MSKDFYHYNVKTALQKDGWQITLLPKRVDISRQASGENNVDAETIFDVERDHYQLVYVGWTKNGLRDYGCLLHLDIKDEKI